MTDQYKVRTTLIFLLFCSLFAVVLFNLYVVQVIQRDFFVDLGHRQYHVSVTQHPPRAEIFDRHGSHLALNQERLAAFVLPKQIEDRPSLEAFLAKHFPAARKRLQQIEPNRHFMFVKRRLTPADIDLIKKSEVTDLHMLTEAGRTYPVVSAAPTVGITDIDNHGLMGIEQQFDAQLAGTPTQLALEQDARSGHFYFAHETKVAGSQGTPVHLTIDADLQFLVHELVKDTVQQFGAQEGSAIIMNPRTGEITALATHPHFDPHNTRGLDIEMTRNRPVSDAYEHGSVMKAFVALAALAEGVVTPDEEIDCENTRSTVLDGVRVNTWREHGVLTFAQIIQKSNNIGIAKVAKRLGEKLYDHYRRLGFGTKTGISLPGEHAGFVNPPENWSRPSIISLSYGYEVSATLLQIARAFCVIANGGHLVTPAIVLEDVQPIDPDAPPIYDPEVLAQMREILEQATQHGTAYRAAIKGYTVMGKTGTSNLLINGKYSPENNTYAFAGIVEKDGYQRVITTFIKNAGRGGLFASQVAAPLFERIAEVTIMHDGAL